MSYRVKINLPARAPLKDKVLLHAKFLKHFQKRKLDHDARGKTAWRMEFLSEQGRFVIFWKREPAIKMGCSWALADSRFLGLVTIVFSKKDIEIGGEMLIVGDWKAIENLQRSPIGRILA